MPRPLPEHGPKSHPELHARCRNCGRRWPEHDELHGHCPEDAMSEEEPSSIAPWGEQGRLQYRDGEPVVEIVTCGVCGRSWNDALITGRTPTPSGRCPFEYEHEGDA